MSEEKKQEYLREIKGALNDVPESHCKEVVKSITHDIGVMAKAIQIVTSANTHEEEKVS